MINLKINVTAKSFKDREFTQTLDSQKTELQQFSPNFQVTKKGDVYNISGDFKTEELFKDALQSKELNILAGAIRTLGEKAVITVQGIGKRKWATEIGGFPIKYIKTTK